MRLRPILLHLIAAGSVLASASAASAIGYYNLPGSFCQCFGYGNGAGYHSCLVLGPSTCEGFCDTHEVRLPCPPQPPYGYYGAGPYRGDAIEHDDADGRSIAERARDAASGAKHAASTARHKVEDAIEGARERASHAGDRARSAREGASHAAGDVRRQGRPRR